jgi:hypothetical protein
LIMEKIELPKHEYDKLVREAAAYRLIIGIEAARQNLAAIQQELKQFESTAETKTEGENHA